MREETFEPGKSKKTVREQEWWGCKRKKRLSKEAAKAKATKGKCYWYSCPWCDGFHLTKKKQKGAGR